MLTQRKHDLERENTTQTIKLRELGHRADEDINLMKMS